MRLVGSIWSLCLAAALVSCQQDPRLPEFELHGSTMGTTFSIKIVTPPEHLSMDALQILLQQSLDTTENLTSTYIEQSELSLFNDSTSTDWSSVSTDLCEVVATALALSRETGGAFDITVGPLVNLWGFGPQEIRAAPPTDVEIEALLVRVGYEKLQARCDQPALRKRHADLFVDLSGWAKGYATDRLADVLDAHSVENYLVEVGGELRARGLNAEQREWAIAIEKPLTDEREVESIQRVSDTGVATSGDYRNYFEHDGIRYSHTIDPRLGRPIMHSLASVTVFDPSAARADGLATALLVLGPVEGPALADRLGLRAYFLLRTPQGFESRWIPAD